MDAQAILEDLLCNDVKIKLAAMDRFQHRLRLKTNLSDVTNDQRVKLMTAVLTILKDSNPKLVVTAFDCITTVISSNADSFLPLINLTFDLMIAKLADTKANIRQRAVEVIPLVIDMVGLQNGIDRLLSHVNHKNGKVKESILQVIVLLQEIHGASALAAAVCPALCSKVCSLLSDPQSTVRYAAVDALTKLHDSFGDSLWATLEALEVRPPVIKSIRDGVAAAPKKAGSTLAGTFRSLARSDSTTAADPLRVPSSGRRCADPVDSCSSEVDDADAAASSLGRSGCASLRRRSVSAGAVSAKQSSPAALQHLGCTSPASFSTTSSSQASHCSSAASAAGRSSFHPASYLPFLGIPASASPAESSATATPRMGGVALVDERSVRAMSNDAEMSRHLRGISAALGCPEDWQARIAALQALQRVCWGYSRDCLAPALQSAGPCSWKAPLVEASLLLQHTKEMCEQISAQVTDLRSVVSKEGCKTVAVLAFSLRQLFLPLVDCLVPALLKQTLVKIQVMSASADKSLRIVIVSSCCCSGGQSSEGKLLALLIEACANKAAAVRRMAAKYVALTCALARMDSLEKNFQALRAVLSHGITDADAQVRKTSRQLFWVLCQRSRQLSAELQAHFLGGDAKKSVGGSTCITPAVQKILRAESEEPVSAELQNLLQMARNPQEVADTMTRFLLWGGGGGAGDASSSSSSCSPFESTDSSVRSGCDMPVDASAHGRASVDAEAAAPADLPPASRRSSMSGAARVARRAPLSTISSSNSIQLVAAQSSDSAPRSAAEPADKSSKQPTAAAREAERPAKTAAQPSIASASTSAEWGSDSSARGWTSSRARQSEAAAPTRVKAQDPAGSAAAAAGASALASGPQRIHRRVGKSDGISSLRGGADESNSDDSHSTSFAAAPPPVDGQSVFVFSREGLQAMVDAADWSSRLKAFDIIARRIERAAAPQSQESLNGTIVEAIIDLSVERLGDTHQKVCGAALRTLLSIFSRTEFAAPSRSRLGAAVTALFHRLTDTRSAVRDQANAILNAVRATFDPLDVVAAVSPRMLDVPDKAKAALLQFLGAVAPYCSLYFNQPPLARAFLGRLATILGAAHAEGGPLQHSHSQAPTTLSVAGRRLLELVYNAAPQAVCRQMSHLALQQQLALKRLLEPAVPDIAQLVVAAAKADWASSAGLLAVPRGGYGLPPAASHRQDHHDDDDDDDRMLSSDDRPAAVSPVEAARARSRHGSDGDGDGELKDEPVSPAEVSQRHIAQVLRPPSCFDTGPGEAEAAPGPVSFIPIPANRGAEAEADAAGRAAAMLPGPIPAAVAATAECCTGGLRRGAPAGIDGTAPAMRTDERDVVWLLGTLRADSDSAGEAETEAQAQRTCGEAWKELKRLTKFAPDKFWEKNCAQVASVLLEVLVAASHLLAVRAAPALTGFSPQPCSLASGAVEKVYSASKALLYIAKLRGPHLKNLMDLLVTTLCDVSGKVPVAVTLLFEQVMEQLAHYDVQRLVHIVCRFAAPGHPRSDPAASLSQPSSPSPSPSSASLRAMSLHVLSASTRFMSSAQLLEELPYIIATTVMPAVNSPLVDLRKAAIFALVEMYLIVGDALYPHLQNLSPPQRKLLTIYIERKVKARHGN